MNAHAYAPTSSAGRFDRIERATPTNEAIIIPLYPEFIEFFDPIEDAIERWHDETCFMSFSDDMMRVGPFSDIVRFGHDSVPYIISDLKERPSFLFLALEAITGESVNTPENIGKTDAVIEAWMAWAERTIGDTRLGYRSKLLPTVPMLL